MVFFGGRGAGFSAFMFLKPCIGRLVYLSCQPSDGDGDGEGEGGEVVRNKTWMTGWGRVG